MEDPEVAERAMKGLQGAKLFERDIRVEVQILFSSMTERYLSKTCIIR